MTCNRNLFALKSLLTVTLIAGASAARAAEADILKAIADLDKKVEKQIGDLDKKIAQDIKKIGDDLVHLQTIIDTELKPRLDKLDRKAGRLDQLERDMRELQETLANPAKLRARVSQYYTPSSADTSSPPGGASLESIQHRLNKMVKALHRLEKAVTPQPTSVVPRSRFHRSSLKPVTDRLDDLLNKLDRVSDQMNRALRKLDSGVSQISLKPPAVGRLVLVNDYADEMVFRVFTSSASARYTLAGGQQRLVLNVPAGRFSYEVWSPVWGVLASRTSTVTPGETVRLTVS